MDAPMLVTLKFPRFGKEPRNDSTEDPFDFVKEPATDSSETVALDEKPVALDEKPTVILPRMRTIATVADITGVALMGGALVQIFYSGLHPLDAWSAPAVYSFLAVMLLNVLWFFFWMLTPPR